MSKIERDDLWSREPLNAMSEAQNAKTTRVLRDGELDAVSGGYTLSNTMISGYAVSRGVARLMENDGIDGALD